MIKPESKKAALADGSLEVGTCPHDTQARREVKRAVFLNLRHWLATGDRYSLRLARIGADALVKESR